MKKLLRSSELLQWNSLAACLVFCIHFKSFLGHWAQSWELSGWCRRTGDPHSLSIKNGVLLVWHEVQSRRFQNDAFIFADDGTFRFVKLHNHTENTILALNTLNRSESKTACRDVVLTYPSLLLPLCCNLAPPLLLRPVELALETPPKGFQSMFYSRLKRKEFN